MGTTGKTWSRLDLAEAEKLYQSGHSCAGVARELGYSASYIAGRFRSAGIPMRPPGRPLPTPAPHVDPAELVRLRGSGLGFSAIADHFGISIDMARARYATATGRPRPARSKALHLSGAAASGGLQQDGAMATPESRWHRVFSAALDQRPAVGVQVILSEHLGRAGSHSESNAARRAAHSFAAAHHARLEHAAVTSGGQRNRLVLVVLPRDVG